MWRAGVRLRAAAYSGLRLPTVNELYRLFSVFPVNTRANPELENEELLGLSRPVLDVVGRGRHRLRAHGVSQQGEERHREHYHRHQLPASGRMSMRSVRQGIEVSAKIGEGPVKFAGSLTYVDSVES